MSWAPLADTLVDSSIWQEEDHVFRVFFAMLSLKGADDIVRYPNAYKLARRIHMDSSMDKVMDALKVLSSPDKRDPNQEFQGRRIEAVEDGWRILNAEKYRRRIALEMKRARDRRAQQAFRERQKHKSNPTVQELHYVKLCNEQGQEAADKWMAQQQEKEEQERQKRKFQKPTLEQVKLQCAKIGLPESEAEHFINHYESNGWKVGRNAMQSWTHALSNWKKNWHEKNTGTNQKRVDRNKGTLNEGTAHLYKAKPINPPS